MAEVMEAGMIAVAEVVLDTRLSPRKVDAHKVRTFRDSIKAGVKLPPIIVCADTGKLVDGRHRLEAHRLEGLTEIEASIEKFEDDAERFLRAVEENQKHGFRLSSYETRQAQITGEELGIRAERMAAALAIPVEGLQRRNLRGYVLEKNTVTGGPAVRRAVALKSPLRHLDGKDLTAQELDVNFRSGGVSPSFHARQLTMYAETGVLVPTRQLVLDAARCVQVLGEWLAQVQEQVEQAAPAA